MKIRLVLAALTAWLSVPAFAAQTYAIDPGHTDVLFSWNHFGFSNPSATFTRIDGTIVYDAADPAKSSVSVTIPVSSIDTHVAKLDEHLQAADFLDARKFPKITFRSRQVKAGEAPNTFEVEGDLTVHGVTRPVTLHAHLNGVGEHPMRKVPAIGFDATTSFKRSDFGIGAYVPNVSDEITVRITTEAVAGKAGK
jgi:polyisoprenoid-binding protein YceI